MMMMPCSRLVVVVADVSVLLLQKVCVYVPVVLCCGCVVSGGVVSGVCRFGRCCACCGFGVLLVVAVAVLLSSLVSDFVLNRHGSG